MNSDDRTVVGTESDFDPNWESVGEQWESGESVSVEQNDGETDRIVWTSSTTDDSTVIFKTTFDS